MSMYTTAQLLAANEQKFKFDPLFLRLFFRESYPFTTEKVYLSQIPGLVSGAPVWASEHQSTLSAGYLHARTNVPGRHHTIGANGNCCYGAAHHSGLGTVFS